jgi:type III secretion protein R
MKGCSLIRRTAWQPKTQTGRVALKLFYVSLCAVTLVVVPSVAEAARKGGGGGLAGMDLTQSEGVANRPLVLMTALAALSLLPFVIMMVTSFVKMAVVLSFIRQALGTQQIPPTPVITGLAIVLTVYVMHPVGLEMKRAADREVNMHNTALLDTKNADLLMAAARKAQVPMVQWLIKHTHVDNRQMFYKVAYRMRSPEDRPNLKDDDLIVIVPAFVISELTEAFQIGFVIFVPFLVLDMVVSNILMALGMQMLSPTTISLPFKILLFVLVDGWYILTKGLVLGYQ